MPPELGLAFDVALHIGTLAAILTFFHADLTAMARALPVAVFAAPDDSGRLMHLIVVGTIPIVIVGLLFTDFVEQRPAHACVWPPARSSLARWR